MMLLDRWMDRLLWVSPDAASDGAMPRGFGVALALSASRCVLQYIVLPFVLPVVGVAAGWSRPMLLALSLLALCSTVGALRRLWRARWVHRWRYLPLALLVLGSLAVFIAGDLRS